jgi:AraC-like DNA-binding protein
LLVDVTKPERVHTAMAKPCGFEFLLAMACGELGADRGGVSMCAVYSPARKNSSTTNSSNAASVGTISDSSNGAQSRTNGVHPSDIEPMVQERRVLKILQMIQSQPLRRIEELAREFNLSHSRLEHLFKQETGVSLGQLLTEQRLTRAAHLLLHTNMRIKEIAHTVGYEHTSSFIRAFERHFMQAPRLYRQKPANIRRRELVRNHS